MGTRGPVSLKELYHQHSSRSNWGIHPISISPTNVLSVRRLPSLYGRSILNRSNDKTISISESLCVVWRVSSPLRRSRAPEGAALDCCSVGWAGTLPNARQMAPEYSSWLSGYRHQLGWNVSFGPCRRPTHQTEQSPKSVVAIDISFLFQMLIFFCFRCYLLYQKSMSFNI